MREPRRREAPRKAALALVALVGIAAPLLAAGDEDVPRTASGRPDFSGHYDVATLTPLVRPQAFGDELFMSREEAERRVKQAALRRAATSQASDPDREAPPDGGDGSPGAAGNVGGYNSFWIDNGTDVFEVDGKFRTSIITHPKNGRFPPVTEAVRQRFASRRGFFAGATRERHGGLSARGRVPTMIQSCGRLRNGACSASARRRDRRCCRRSTTT